MLKWFQQWRAKRRQQKIQRLCCPCETWCGDELCAQVGCLNTTMRYNKTRLKVLAKRLAKLKANHENGTPIPVTIVRRKAGTVIKLDDFR